MTKGHARKREIRQYMELNPGVRYTEAARIVADMRANGEIPARNHVPDEGSDVVSIDVRDLRVSDNDE